MKTEEQKRKARESQQKYRDKAAFMSFMEKIGNAEKFWSRVDIRNEEDCWEWMGAKKNGTYGFYAPMPGVLLKSHRVAYALFNGFIDDNLLVCHKCDNPSCCNPEHLFLGTSQDNIQDMIRKSRKASTKGTCNPSAKLTPEQVRAIFVDSRINKEIAQDYKIQPSLVSQIRRRAIWSDTTYDLPNQPIRKTGPRPRLTSAQLQALTA